MTGHYAAGLAPDYLLACPMFGDGLHCGSTCFGKQVTVLRLAMLEGLCDRHLCGLHLEPACQRMCPGPCATNL